MIPRDGSLIIETQSSHTIDWLWTSFELRSKTLSMAAY